MASFVFNQPIQNPDEFLQMLVLSIGREFTSEEKSSFYFISERFLKHHCGLSFCFYVADSTGSLDFYQRNPSIFDEVVTDGEDSFEYGINFSYHYDINLHTNMEQYSNGVLVSHCITDFDEIPKPSLLPWGFHNRDFFEACELQKRRANKLWIFLNKERHATQELVY